MSYGDSINVAGMPYNKINHSRMVEHSFSVKNNGETKYVNNVLNYAVKKAQIPAIFGKDIVEISTANRTQYKFIRKVLNLLKASYKVK